VPIDRRGISLLASGHGAVDLGQGTVPALLPFLIHSYGFSYTQATALLIASAVTSSVIQPFFGHIADRRSMNWMLPVGVLASGVGISLVGFSHNYWLTFLLVAIAGLGAGIYHPEAARFANYASGHRAASGMSLFVLGGNSGFALGPILITPLILLFGLKGTAFLAIPFLIVAFLIATNLGYLESFRPVQEPEPDSPGADGRGKDTARRESETAAAPAENWWGFTLSTSIAGLRSGVYFGLQAFVPSFLIVTYALSEGEANVSLMLMLGLGAVGTLIGGMAADRYGLKPVVTLCMAVLAPMILLLLISGPVLSMVWMGLLGFFSIATFSLTVVLGQHYLPNRIGLASGFTLGASSGAGGILAAILGPIADSSGVETVLVIIAGLPILALVCALLLPKAPSRRTEPQTGAAPAPVAPAPPPG
jgi:FSR family fosmidomycin resistance protein-like MFS transporter